jgi:cyclin-dependent kinase 12/13
MTNNVVTMFYKPPELLLGVDSYGPALDVWSCGCVFAEMLLRRPFPGAGQVSE